ncbi:MAG TPA: hypothetical protein VM553_13570 [Dongiaceae bacterium]|nr:hypothetical protein [Dongiaceae bacterium]
MQTEVDQNRWWMFCLSIVMFDSLFQYFLANLAGFTLPINALLPLLVVVGIYRFGAALVFPPMSTMIPVAILLSGCLVGVAVVPESGMRNLFEMGTALSALIIGYQAFRTGAYSNRSDSLVRWFLMIGLIYSAVCTVAILKLVPGLLPVHYSVGLREGVLVSRAEITTDQNFQIYYLFTSAFVLAAPFKIWRTLFAIAALLGAFFVVAKLQTRSGAILLAMAITMSVFASLRLKAGGKAKLVIIPSLLLVLAYFGLDLVKSQGSELITRFQEKEYETLYSRLFAAVFFFDKLTDLEYWMPQGNAGYMARYGGLPHFTPAGFLLEGGILAVVGSFFAFYFPIFRLGTRYVLGRLNLVSCIAFVGGLVAIVASLSLNALFFEHMWLWGGAVLGALVRQFDSASANRSVVDESLYNIKPKLLQV